ncbi:MAG: FkbM family methyltransferase [Mitsuokella sp.]
MNNVLVFGMGKRFRRYENEIEKGKNILAYVDNGDKNETSYKGKPIIKLNRIKDFSYDGVLIVPVMGRMEIIRKCLENGIDCKKIIPWFPEGSKIWKKQNIEVLPTGEISALFDDISFYMKHDSDSFVCEELFLMNEYAFSFGDKPITVIDIGMNIGCASLLFASHENVRQVYSYEPFPRTYREALDNFSRNGEAIRNKIIPHNYALSGHDGETTVHFYEEFPGGMTIVKDHPSWGKQEVTVQIRKASDELKEILDGHMQDLILMKIDCEGSEYEILQDMDAHNLIEKVDAFIMESHFGRENEIVDCLKRKGFYVFYPYIGNGQGYIYAVNSRK